MKVAELIHKLSVLDPEQTVVIEDCDTNWLLNILRVEIIPSGYAMNCILIAGDYSDEYD